MGLLNKMRPVGNMLLARKFFSTKKAIMTVCKAGKEIEIDGRLEEDEAEAIIAAIQASLTAARDIVL